MDEGNSARLRGDSGDVEPAETPSPTDNPCSFSPLPSAAPELAVLHSTYPTPVSRSSEESIANRDENCSPETSEFEEKFVAKSRPKLDESDLVNYNSYRHKLIEETLQKQYGGGYAPGNVILNLIQLNTADSSVSIVLSKKYDKNFSDQFKFGETVTSLWKNSDVDQSDADFLDPLAHFIPRNLRKPSTTETQTETAPVSEISIAPIASIAPSARPYTPTSCQKIISKRSREANYAAKSPFVTPIHSQAPLNANPSKCSESNPTAKGEVNLLANVVLLRDQDPLTEQLYRRNDTRPDVVSKTHVEAEEYLNRIAKNKMQEAAARQKVLQEPRIRSSLKKSRRQVDEGKKFTSDNEKVETDRTGDCGKIRKSLKDDIRRLSTSKPTIWNN